MTKRQSVDGIRRATSSPLSFADGYGICYFYGYRLGKAVDVVMSRIGNTD